MTAWAEREARNLALLVSGDSPEEAIVEALAGALTSAFNRGKLEGAFNSHAVYVRQDLVEAAIAEHERELREANAGAEAWAAVGLIAKLRRLMDQKQ